MNRSPRWAAVAVPLLLLAAGCAGESGAGQGPTPAPPSGSSSPSPSGSVRGAVVDSFECTTEDDQGLPAATGRDVAVPASSVQALELCPLMLPTGAARPVVIARGQAGFNALVALLSAPDKPRTTQMCPMYADQPQVVLARAGDTYYALRIPVDACGHYQHPEILGALRQG